MYKTIIPFLMKCQEVTSDLPVYDQQRQILATDSLAFVGGFRVMVDLTMQSLFRMICLCKMSTL